MSIEEEMKSLEVSQGTDGSFQKLLHGTPEISMSTSIDISGSKRGNRKKDKDEARIAYLKDKLRFLGKHWSTGLTKVSNIYSRTNSSDAAATRNACAFVRSLTVFLHFLQCLMTFGVLIYIFTSVSCLPDTFRTHGSTSFRSDL